MRSFPLTPTALAALAALGCSSIFGCTPLLGEHEPPTGQVDAAVPDVDASQPDVDAAHDPCDDLPSEARCADEGASCDGRTLVVCARDTNGCLRAERTACAPAGDCDRAAGACTPRVTGIAAGWAHACALWSDGSVACWGQNDHGQLGDGTTVNRLAPTRVEGLEGVAQIAAGATQTCAVLGDGSVRCWGQNIDGRLGDGTTTERLRPTAVGRLPEPATAISSFGGHTCALLASGAVACWGYNGAGQLGPDAPEPFASEPVLVPGLTDARAVGTGADHSCARLDGGEVRCWGQNTVGQLGDGWPLNRATPAPVEGVDGSTALAVGAGHACAVVGGEVRCWGQNDRGQLGVEQPRLTRWVAAPVVTGAAAIAAGATHTCALLADGAVSCWGDNLEGALGDGTLSSRAAAQPVTGLTGTIAIAAGLAFSCAVTGEGTSIQCWGRNDVGQLGLGTTEAHTRPATTFGAASSPGSCSDDADCPAAAEPCGVAICQAGTCAVAPAPMDTECRAAWGGCDVPERCDGTSLDCPADEVAAAGAACATGVGCGTGEACDGASPACPSDPYCAGELAIAAGGNPRAPHTEVVVAADEAVTLYLGAPHNLLVNGGAEARDLRGWTSSFPDAYGLTERRLFGGEAFVGTYSSETLTQSVDLVAAGLTPDALDARSVPISVFQLARGGEENDDVVQLVVEYLGAEGTTLGSYDSTPQTAAVGVWQLLGEGELAYPPGTRAIRVRVTTQDGDFWGGNFGTILDGASVVAGRWEMQLSNDGVTWGDWTAFTPTVTWELAPGEGVRSVGVRFRDADTGELAGAAYFEVRAEAM